MLLKFSLFQRWRNEGTEYKLCAQHLLFLAKAGFGSKWCDWKAQCLGDLLYGVWPLLSLIPRYKLCTCQSPVSILRAWSDHPGHVPQDAFFQSITDTPSTPKSMLIFSDFRAIFTKRFWNTKPVWWSNYNITFQHLFCLDPRETAAKPPCFVSIVWVQVNVLLFYV